MGEQTAFVGAPAPLKRLEHHASVGEKGAGEIEVDSRISLRACGTWKVRTKDVAELRFRGLRPFVVLHSARNINGH